MNTKKTVQEVLDGLRCEAGTSSAWHVKTAVEDIIDEHGTKGAEEVHGLVVAELKEVSRRAQRATADLVGTRDDRVLSIADLALSLGTVIDELQGQAETFKYLEELSWNYVGMNGESIFEDLLEWERFMGGFEAPVWDRVRKLAGVQPPEETEDE